MPRKSIYGENAKLWTCRLYSWEKQLVKDFIKKLREKKRKQLKNGTRRRT